MLGWKCFPEGEKGGELGVKEWKQREKEIHKKKKVLQTQAVWVASVFCAS